MPFCSVILISFRLFLIYLYVAGKIGRNKIGKEFYFLRAGVKDEGN